MEKVTVSTTILAPASVVWERYTEPEHITQWSFASDDWECTSASNDLRVGGSFCNHLAAKDRSFEFDFEGVYTEVEPGRSLGYTMGDGRTASVDLQSGAQGTTITVTFDPESENPIDLQRSGWQAFLDNFKKYVESAA